MTSVFRLETLHELNTHAERLMAALYSVSKELQSKDFEFMTSSKAGDFAKGKTKDPKLTAYLTSERVEGWGRLLRHPYAVLQHVYSWQMAAYEALCGAQENSGDWDLTWNYLYCFPALNLFRNYVKIHIFLTQIPNTQLAVTLYKRCLAFFGKQDQNLDGLANFLKSRETLKACESEIQRFEGHVSSAFKALLPSLQLALGLASTFPWKLLSLTEKPKPMLPSDIFFKDNYVLLMNLPIIAEAFLLFGIFYMQFLASDPFFADAFAMVVSYCLVLHLVGSINVEIRSLFMTIKKMKDKEKDKKWELDTSFIESSDDKDKEKGSYARQRSSQAYCRRKLTVITKEFVAACQVDASIVCTKHAVALAILGFTSFELQVAFNLKRAKPALDPYVLGEVSELMYWFTKLVAVMTQMIPDIQRYFLFNLREFDCNFLDTLAHSYVIPQYIYQKIATLVSALRTLNIEDFDNGEDLDLYPCISMTGSIASAFNSFGRARGITHLSQLLQLVSGCGVRLRLFQDTFGEILKFSYIHTFWQYLDNFSEITKEVKEVNAKYNVFALHMAHFYGMDEAAVAEIPKLDTEIKTSYNAAIGQTVNVIFDWFKALQERCFSDIKKLVETQPFAVVAEGEARKADPSDLLLQKITFTLAAAQEIGVIQVLGDEHNVFGELANKVGTIMSSLFFNEETRPPIEFTKKIQAARWALQLVCSAANFPFHHTVFRNMLALSAGKDGEDTLGPIGQGYLKKYVDLASTVLKSAYYSNAQEMFVPCDERAPGQSIVYHYLSLPALHALHDLIGTNGCQAITKQLAKLAAQLTKPLIQQIAQVMKNSSSFEDGFCQFADSDKMIKSLGHIAAVLKLREMLRPFVGEQMIPTKPEFDLDVIVPMQEAGVVEVMTDISSISVLGALLSSSYWEKFDYDVSHDAIVDNSHIWGHVFDVWVGAVRNADKRDKVLYFYRQLFAACLKSINKGREVYGSKLRGKWPGMNLIILVDHLVTDSKYADYSDLEPYVAYHYIRSLYTAKLSKPAPSK